MVDCRRIFLLCAGLSCLLASCTHSRVSQFGSDQQAALIAGAQENRQQQVGNLRIMAREGNRADQSAVVRAEGIEEEKKEKEKTFVLPVADSQPVPPSPELLPTPLPSLDGVVERTNQLTLDELQELALKNHPAVHEAIAVANKSRGFSQQAGAYPNPTVSYSAAEIGAEGKAGQQGFNISQTIVTNKKLEWNQTVAEHDVTVANWQWHTRQARIRTDVRLQFYEILGAKKRVALAKGLLKIADHGVDVTKQLLKASLGTTPDVLESQIQREQVRNLLRNAEIELQVAWKKLANLVGLPRLESVGIIGELNTESLVADEESSYQQLLKTSPQLQAASSQIARSQADICRQEARVRPNILAQFGVARDTSSDETVVNLQIGLPLPFFNKNRGNIAAANSEYFRASRRLERLQLALRLRLIEAMGNFQKLKKQDERYRAEIVPQSEKNLKLIEEGYKKQQFNFLRVLTARRLYAETHLSHIAILVKLRQAETLIEGMLLDGGLSDVDDVSSAAEGLRGDALGGQ